ncbi:Hypothetical predicted protein [Lecanosticta acicola]|uniref:Mitochondrial carrier n=1 Tax=Lecanosticta acicola TaxID=111012 RepID=A0AAI8YV46_9PEZI|nr:Hypothetical predicted protein [Lecanosticta acicola]
MSADFWSGYVSGAIGILVGNPLDIIKTKLQSGSAKSAPEGPITRSGTDPRASPSASLSENSPPSPVAQHKPTQRWASFARGAAAPILGYGALNALLFVSYNRSLALLSTGNLNEPPETPSAWSIWTAGALGGLATFFVSAPTELIKCRAQVSNPPRSSLQIARELWKAAGLRGLYMGGAVTSIRDAVGYGF